MICTLDAGGGKFRYDNDFLRYPFKLTETSKACARSHKTWCNDSSSIECVRLCPAHFIWEQIGISIVSHYWQHTEGHLLKALTSHTSPPCIFTFNKTQAYIMSRFLAADSHKSFPFLFGLYFSTTGGCRYSRYSNARWAWDMAMDTSNTCCLYR